ncbi:MAG: hypothetical protein ABIH92_02245 [Nanoarchaeota archaeon]
MIQEEMNNQPIEESSDSEETNQGDIIKERIVRGVLLFSAIVIAIVAIYTTAQLFSSQDIELSFSPPEQEKLSIDLNPRQNKESFEKDIEDGKAFEKMNPGGEESQETKEYKSGTIDPYDLQTSPSINPLVIYDELPEPVNKIVVILAILEVIAIVIIYRRLDKKLARKRN